MESKLYFVAIFVQLIFVAVYSAINRRNVYNIYLMQKVWFCNYSTLSMGLQC